MARSKTITDSTLDDILDDDCDCIDCRRHGERYPLEAVVNAINGLPVLYLERPTIGEGH